MTVEHHPPRLERLTVEHLEGATGVEGVPRFGWLRPTAARQTAWRIRLLAAGNVYWDSGVIEGSETFEVPYGGPPLADLRRYDVDILSWSGDDLAEGSLTFVTGVPAESVLWDASRWIGGQGASAAPLLRRDLDLDDTPTSAFLVVAAGGYARAEINGSAVPPQMLSPGFTDYDTRVQYTVTDVTAMLAAGANVVGVELGRGFYGVQVSNEWDWQSASWNDAPCLRALLVWDTADGRRHVVGTDVQWRCVEGPTRSDDLFAGEDYDDRLAIAGWSRPGIDLGDWEAVRSADGPRGRLEAQRQQPIIVAEELGPIRVELLDEGWLFTFPRVISGWVKVDLDGPENETVEIRLAERLGIDGLPDVSDPHGYYAGRFQTHRVTLAGRPLTWEPRFTYQGFQYVLVVASHRPRVRAQLVHTATERTGAFSSSSPLLNELHELAVRTVLNNLHGYPSDTPSYEKNGWTGDGMLGAELMLLNLDSHAVLAKWIQDVADSMKGTSIPSVIAPDGGWRVDWSPAPPWHSALVLVPWWLHQYRGDVEVVRKLWPSITRYLRAELARCPDGIASTTLGDWVTPETSPAGGNPPEDSRVPATAFLFVMLRAAASLAKSLGEDAAPWLREAGRVRSAYLAAFLDRDRALVRGAGEAGIRQTHQILALAFGIVPRAAEAGVAAALAADVRERNCHLNTGALGTKWLLPVLTRFGYPELALAIAEQRDYPSWGYWVEQGATTLWEHWDLRSRSRNHYFLGTFDDWLFHDVAGLRPLEPAWRSFEVSPQLTHLLTAAEASVLTPLGEAAVRWRRLEDEVEFVVRVPSGARANLVLEGERRNLTAGIHQLRLPSRRRKQSVDLRGKTSGDTV